MKARDNPFSTARVLALRYLLQPADWDELLKRLADLRFRAALVGHCGSGKTTLLENLEVRLAAKGFRVHWLRLNQHNRSLPAEFTNEVLPNLKSHDMVLLDGAEQLSWWKWMRFKRQTRRAGGLIITTHRPGRLPTLRTCATDLNLLSWILQTLIGPDADKWEREATRLFHHHRGNIRSVLRALYDRWAATGVTPPLTLADRSDALPESPASRALNIRERFSSS